MDQVKIDIEDLIPHRNSMKLIDRIIEISGTKVLAKAKIRSRWFDSNAQGVNPLLFIELIAQSSASIRGFQSGDESDSLVGLIVGIKKAQFFKTNIPVESELAIEAEQINWVAGYGVFQGTVKLDNDILCTAELQVYQTNRDRNKDEIAQCLTAQESDTWKV